jgi:nanoRNase/pAp phosphatase (c-di-AMP/oligoRNAs hydrolase)
LNKLAEKLNGGGHAGASGGFSKTYENAIEIIKEWAYKNQLSIYENQLNY